MKKTIALLLAMGIIGMVFMLGCAQATTQDLPPSPPSTPSGTENAPPSPPGAVPPLNPPSPSIAGSVTTAQLSQHNSGSNCWVAFQGMVYDITGYLPKHPGEGRGIIPYCGTSSEFESAFVAKHGMSKVATMVSQTTFMGALGS